MIGKLREISKNTLFGVLPNVINTNNKIIEEEFDNIYDSEQNVLKKSVYVPNGNVTAHWGKFVNLQVRTITIEDTDSLSGIIVNVPHNQTKTRFYKDFVNSDTPFDPEKDSAHDIDMIYGLRELLNKMSSDIKKLWVRVSLKSNPPFDGSSIDWGYEIPDDGNDDIQLLGSFGTPSGMIVPNSNGTLFANSSSDPLIIGGETDNTHSDPRLSGSVPTRQLYKYDENIANVIREDVQFYNYPNEYYALPLSDIKDNLEMETDGVDIVSGQKYGYIYAYTPYIKITNRLPFAIHANRVGQQVTLLFESDKNNNDMFKVKLASARIASKYKNLIVRNEDRNYTRVTLVCINIDPELGTEWYLLNYSGKINLDF